MKQTRETWNTIFERIAVDDEGKFDEIRSPSKQVRWNYVDSEGKGKLMLYEQEMNVPERKCHVTDWALSQLCQKLQIPKRYFDRCGDSLKERNFNYWISRYVEEKNWLLRFKGDMLRGVLSSKYSKISNMEIAEILAAGEILGNKEKVAISQFWLDDKAFHIRFVFPDTEVSNNGHKLWLGCHVANSEVGAHSVMVDSTLHNPDCLNVVVVESIMRQRHIWMSQDRLYQKTVFAVADAIKISQYRANDFLKLVDRPVEMPIDLIEKICEQNQLSKERADEVKLKFQENPEGTEFGIAQAFSAAGRDEDDIDKRLMLEKIPMQLIKVIDGEEDDLHQTMNDLRPR